MPRSQRELDEAILSAAGDLNDYYPTTILPHQFYMAKELPGLSDAIERVVLAVRARREAMRPHKAAVLGMVEGLNMPKAICVKCKLFFRPKTNDVVWEEGRPVRDSEEWAAYKLWMADLWECRGCGAQIITGHGHGPISEHYKPDYEHTKASYPDVLRVNDC